MKFGIITPVFDGCVESLELVYRELRLQTHKDWVWMLCSNGYSIKLAEFAREVNRHRDWISRLLNRSRTAYISTEYEEEKNAFDILENVSKRRDFCIRRIDCDYILLIDPDAKILEPMMFEILNTELKKTRSKICLFNIIHEVGRLPIFPIELGRIDALNFCVETTLARRIGYPTDINRSSRKLGNDFRFFDSLRRSVADDYLYLDKTFFEHNGNNRYENLTKLLNREIG